MTPENLLNIAIIIFLLPLVSFLINIFFGKRLGRVSSYIGTTILGIDLILALVVFINKVFYSWGGHFSQNADKSLTYMASDAMVQLKYAWINFGNFNVKVGIGIDNLAAVMLVVVTLISFLVHLFSTEYMRDDKRFPRFYAYLGIFTFSMLGIVLANNFLFMYTFWELVGVSSYLLIGFWYEKDSASNAAKKAFLVNRVGDLGFFTGIMILYFTYGTFMYDEVFGTISTGILPFDSGTMLTVAGILIFMGAVGKSAQFPLHIWLPDAMEGPTPVSALIHAATMVAAGVYLVAKVYPMLTANALLYIAYTGAITAFIAATIALTQNDFKKVLAYSTVSQLGFMVMSLGVGSYMTGFFHLVTHAWFKAALFLGSGSVIHAMHHSAHHLHDHHTDPQDIRNMGGLRKTMPLTYATFLFATLAISGVPLTSGFLSKDAILAGTMAFGNLTGHWLIPISGFTAAAMTAFYMFRLTILSFHGEHKTQIAAQTKENKFVIVFPLVLLVTLSLWIWYSPNPLDANSGWFAKKLTAPTTVVPANLQWSFLLPEAKEEAKTSHEAAAPKAEEAKHTTEATSAEHSTTEKVATEEPAKTEPVVAEHKTEEVKKEEHKPTEVHASVPSHEGAKVEHAAAGHGSHYINKFAEEMHHFHLTAMIMSLIIAGCGIGFSFFLYQFKLLNPDSLANQFRPLYNLSYNKWYIDEIYNATIIAFTMFFAKFLALFDGKVIDGIVNLVGWFTKIFGQIVGIFDNVVIDGFVNLIAKITSLFGGVIRKVQTGRVQTYIAFTIIAIIMLIFVFK
jgi:NADH-quinone oxidoreductase subunit L